MQKLKEKQLLYKIKVGKDADAFASLYDMYISRVYRFVYFKVSNQQDAEDITADLFLKAWKYLTSDDTKEVGSFSGLIYDMARNATVDWYRKNAQSHICALDDIMHLSDRGDILQYTADRSDSAALLKCIKSMKHEYQEVLVLRYVEELSLSEIATLLGRSQVSVRVTLHRATKKLKELAFVDDQKIKRSKDQKIV